MKKTHLWMWLALLTAIPAWAAPFLQSPQPEVAAPASMIEGDSKMKDGVLSITLRSSGAPMTPWVHVFLDTTDQSKGYTHGSHAAAGTELDLLIEGNMVYRFAGSDAEDWKWEPIAGATADRKITADALEVSLPLGALELRDERVIKAFAATYVDNYAVTLDTLPRANTSWTFKVSPETSAPASAKPAISTTPVALLPQKDDIRSAFRKIKSYHCYYGKGHTEELLTRDASIIETRAQTPEEVNALRSAGRIALGYISIGEDDKIRIGDAQGPGGFDSAYFDRNKDGQPDKNATWSSYYTNAESPAWREFFLSRADRMIKSHGVDGFFLDTVETCLLYPESFEGMASLIQELRARHPKAVIVLNRGWDILPKIGETADGLMFESFTLSYDFGDKAYVVMRPSAWDHGLEIWQRFLKPAQEKYGLVVLALDYAGSAEAPGIEQAYGRAATLGLVPCVTTISLDAFYNISRAGIRDEKWLRPFETKESRIFTLDVPRNGFPGGTQIRPSSNYPDYVVAAVVDGVAAGEPKKALGWRNRAWASLEEPGEHLLEFSLPEAVPAKTVDIEWAWDNGTSFPAKNFRVEVQPAGAVGQWATVANLKDNEKETNSIALPEGEITGLRIVQNSAGGASLRPNLMWVQQVRLNP